MDYETEADSAAARAASESGTPESAGEAYEMATNEPATDATFEAHDAAADAQTALGAHAEDAAASVEQAAADATDALTEPAEHLADSAQDLANDATDTLTMSADHVADGATDASDSFSYPYSMPDLGSDADVMDDAFASSPRPPEWPAADLAAASSAADMGDDSDAPVLEDAADAAAPPEHINLSQGVGTISAGSVTLSQGGAGQVHADEMHVSQSGVGLARVNNLTLGDGASAFAVLADQATVEEGSNTFLVVSRSVNGEVKSTVDWRAALAFGAGLGLVVSILRRLR